MNGFYRCHWLILKKSHFESPTFTRSLEFNMASNRMNASFVLSQLDDDFDDSGSDGSDIELENVGVDTLDGKFKTIHSKSLGN